MLLERSSRQFELRCLIGYCYYCHPRLFFIITMYVAHESHYDGRVERASFRERGIVTRSTHVFARVLTLVSFIIVPISC